jgi:bis(5'-nucleosidyl)-tetraphosphatase
MDLEASYGIIPLKKRSGVWNVLLVQLRSGNHWGFPKGKLIGKEAPREAAVRELEEETGLKIKRFLTNSELKEQYKFLRKGDEIKKTVTYFIAEVEGSIHTQEEEIVNCKWVPLFEAEIHITYPEGRNICLQVLHLFDSLISINE